jgi:hypothetical protein
MSMSLPTTYTLTGAGWSAVLNGQPFVDQWSNWIQIVSEAGWKGSPAPRTNTVARQGADGGDDGPVYEDGRLITLKGVIYGADPISLLRAVDRINGLLVAGVRQDTLVVAEPHLTRQCTVRRDGAKPAAVWSPFLATFDLNLYAADSYRYSAVLHQVPTGLYSGASGRAYPKAYPFAYGALGNQGIVTITNAGDLPAYPVITLTPAAVPLVNPQVQLVGGGAMLLSLTVNVGDSLVIDCANETVLLNGVASRFTSLTGDFFSCPGQANSQVLFTADSGLGSTMTVAWRDTYS